MTENPAAEKFDLLVSVETGDIDQLKHVNNTVYLRWVQDAAIAHWIHAASKEEIKDYMWIVTRHEIDYKHPAVLGDMIIARTWVGKSEKINFERNTEILRASDLKLLASARTLWCPIDPVSGRLKRVSEETRKRFSINN